MNMKRITQWKNGQETCKRHFIEVEKHEDTKRCVTLLVIREMQIWTGRRCHFMSIVGA